MATKSQSFDKPRSARKQRRQNVANLKRAQKSLTNRRLRNKLGLDQADGLPSSHLPTTSLTVKSPQMQIAGKVIIVTGGAHGIGRALCERFVRDSAKAVLIADLGVLSLFPEAKRAGLLPGDMQAKVSVMLPAANPASARVLERLGA